MLRPTLLHLSPPFALFAFLSAALSSQSTHSLPQPTPYDEGPPPAFDGVVGDATNPDTHFYYGSDVDTDAYGRYVLNHIIINRHQSNPLYVVWEKGMITRISPHTIGPGDHDENPHHIAGYDTDTNAPIRYTQAGRERMTAIYFEPSTTERALKALISILRTFFRSDNEKQELSVRTEVTPGDNTIGYQISARPSDITLAFSSSALPFPADSFVKQLQPQGVSIRQSTLAEAVNPDQRPSLPEYLTRESFWILSPGPLGLAESISISVPAVAREQTRGIIACLDNHRNLIATGWVSVYRPALPPNVGQ